MFLYQGLGDFMRKEWEMFTDCPDFSPTSVYRYWGKSGDLLYIGKARDFETRDKAHRKDGAWRMGAAFACVEDYISQDIALAAEAVLIRDFCPPFNIINRNLPRIAPHHVRWFDPAAETVVGSDLRWMSCPPFSWGLLEECEAPEWANVEPVTMPVNQPTDIR
jgi:hypothetical protein